MPSARVAWAAFGVLVALNAAWLYHDVRAERPDRLHDEAYADCRNAVRRAREDAARIPFPTRDLVRVTARDEQHVTVRGFYEPRGGAKATWYRCELASLGDHRWRVDTLVFDR